jgi:EAL domain-containing protein (putative c-di-GMP-specific phosphodiesterase class I)/GGDEF domain-containing protein
LLDRAATDPFARRFRPLLDLHRVAVAGHHLRLSGPGGAQLCTAATQPEAHASPSLVERKTIAPLLIVALDTPALWEVSACHGLYWTEHLLARLGAHPHAELVIDVSAAARTASEVDVAILVKALRRQGMRWAVGRLGDAPAHLRLWSELGPDFVMIDGALTHGIGRSMRRLDIARAVAALGHAMGSTLIATEVSELDDLAALRDLGVSCAQGPLMGDPVHSPMVMSEVSAAVQDALHGPAPDTASPVAQESLQTVLRNLAVVRAPSVQWHTVNEEVFDLFESRMDLQALPVVEDERPVGLIGRLAFMNAYARPQFRESAGRAPCRALANPTPHIVELDADMQDLVSALMASDQRYLTEGFIVTEQGRYVGLGRADQLVRAVTELRVEAARHANPLTFLPGNIPISIHIEHLLIENIPFVACYGDLNNFKAFNDHYGYWRGDEMIRLLARIAVRNADPKRDFVGHIGGDDFLVLFQSEDWKQRSLRMIEQFESAAMRLYDESERDAGGIEGEDRHGVLRFFGFTSLSIGALLVAPGDFEDAQDVANAAALAKHEAKLAATGLTIREAGGPLA